VTQRKSSEELNALSREIIGGAIEVHRQLGPGLLEATYSACMAAELKYLGMRVAREVLLPLRYRDVAVDNAYRIDLLVNDELIIEVKAVGELLPVHSAQLMTYLRLSGSRLGLLMNFNVEVLRNGIKRVANGL
jgi:GxxExxY protein